MAIAFDTGPQGCDDVSTVGATPEAAIATALEQLAFASRVVYAYGVAEAKAKTPTEDAKYFGGWYCNPDLVALVPRMREAWARACAGATEAAAAASDLAQGPGACAAASSHAQLAHDSATSACGRHCAGFVEEGNAVGLDTEIDPNGNVVSCIRQPFIDCVRAVVADARNAVAHARSALLACVGQQAIVLRQSMPIVRARGTIGDDGGGATTGDGGPTIEDVAAVTGVDPSQLTSVPPGMQGAVGNLSAGTQGVITQGLSTSAWIGRYRAAGESIGHAASGHGISVAELAGLASIGGTILSGGNVVVGAAIGGVVLALGSVISDLATFITQALGWLFSGGASGPKGQICYGCWDFSKSQGVESSMDPSLIPGGPTDPKWQHITDWTDDGGTRRHVDSSVLIRDVYGNLVPYTLTNYTGASGTGLSMGGYAPKLPYGLLLTTIPFLWKVLTELYVQTTVPPGSFRYYYYRALIANAELALNCKPYTDARTLLLTCAYAWNAMHKGNPVGERYWAPKNGCTTFDPLCGALTQILGGWTLYRQDCSPDGSNYGSWCPAASDVGALVFVTSSGKPLSPGDEPPCELQLLRGNLHGAPGGYGPPAPPTGSSAGATVAKVGLVGAGAAGAAWLALGRPSTIDALGTALARAFGGRR